MIRSSRKPPAFLGQLPPPDSQVIVDGLPGGAYKTVMLTRDEDVLRVESPRVGGRPVPAKPGRDVRLQYSLRSVPCIALGTVTEAVDGGFLMRVRNVDRLQRRGAVRVPAQIAVPVMLMPPEAEEPLNLRMVSADISASGIALRTPGRFPVDSTVSMRLELGEHVLHVSGLVVRIAEDPRVAERRWTLGVRFQGLERDQQEALVRFTMAREREIRRRELGLD
ncbi:MAG: PilZ domain-containing protein [Thermoleophilia bacterium]